MISVPVQAANMSVTTLFPDAASSAWGFTSAYVGATTLSTGVGYWLNFNAAKTYSVTGAVVRPVSIPVSAGWSIIGPFDFDVATSSIATSPSSMVISKYYGFNNGYSEATTLTVGKGYWVKASQAGSLSITPPITGKIVEGLKPPATTQGTDVVSIDIEDGAGHSQTLSLAEGSELERAELPPVPPQGIFDVRFVGNTAVEQSGTGQHEIQISSAVYPIKVLAVRTNGKSLWIKDGVGGTILNERLDEGRAIMVGSSLSELILSEGNEQVGLPVGYSLSQNYPNPFNPTTVIGFALPAAGHVRLSVYNAIGEKLMDLVDGERGAGSYQVVFNGKGMPSGIYFYRLEAGSFVGVKRLVLVK